MNLEVNEALFGKIYPYIEDDNVTDIKWNGRNLWINDLNKGRFIARDGNGNPITLDRQWMSIFITKLANSVNANFNLSSPSLQAETEELRIHAVHNFVSGDDEIALAIRKTPSISRLKDKDLIAEGYVDEMVDKMLPCLIRAHLSGTVIGDVGSGKTELEKYLASFIPDVDAIVTVEDTLEMKLSRLYPMKDVYSIKVTDDYTSVDAIRDALRLLTKWLILSEARGREVVQVMEAASTGCVALTSIHAENTWEIPDRVVNMAGNDVHSGFENDVFTFFDYAIKVKADISSTGIHRAVDQISFFDRTDGVNSIVTFYKDGKLTGEPLPARVLEKFELNNETEFLDYYYKLIGKTPAKKVEKKEVENVIVEPEQRIHLPEAEVAVKEVINKVENRVENFVNQEVAKVAAAEEALAEKVEEVKEEVKEFKQEVNDLEEKIEVPKQEVEVEPAVVNNDNGSMLFDLGGDDEDNGLGDLSDLDDLNSAKKNFNLNFIDEPSQEELSKISERLDIIENRVEGKDLAKKVDGIKTEDDNSKLLLIQSINDIMDTNTDPTVQITANDIKAEAEKMGDQALAEEINANQNKKKKKKFFYAS